MNETSDQMPAYQGWSEDYTLLLGYLEDMIVYDISDSSTTIHFSTINNSGKALNKEWIDFIQSPVGAKKPQRFTSPGNPNNRFLAP